MKYLCDEDLDSLDSAEIQSFLQDNNRSEMNLDSEYDFEKANKISTEFKQQDTANVDKINFLL